MYRIEIYKQEKDLNFNLLPFAWVVASEHTSEIDANDQFQRFIAGGIAEDKIRLISPN